MKFGTKSLNRFYFPLLFFAKKLIEKKSNGQFRILISFGNGIFPPVSAPLMHVIY